MNFNNNQKIFFQKNFLKYDARYKAHNCQNIYINCMSPSLNKDKYPYSERTENKISKGKKHRGQGSDKTPSTSFLESSPSEVRQNALNSFPGSHMSSQA